jgi:hypothetical protein
MNLDPPLRSGEPVNRVRRFTQTALSARNHRNALMDCSQSPRLYGRAQLAMAYLILLATCTAGVFQAPWWAAIAGACSLALVSLIAQKTVSLHVEMMSLGREPVLLFASLFNATAAACAAFTFGHVARWAWGL